MSISFINNLEHHLKVVMAEDYLSIDIDMLLPLSLTNGITMKYEIEIYKVLLTAAHY